MPASNSPVLIIEFRCDRARFQSPGHLDRVDKIMRTADQLVEKAVVERDRLKVRARL